MKTMEQPVQQDAAEYRIEPLSSEEINAVSGGVGPNRLFMVSVNNAPAAPRSTAITGGKTYGW